MARHPGARTPRDSTEAGWRKDAVVAFNGATSGTRFGCGCRRAFLLSHHAVGSHGKAGRGRGTARVRGLQGLLDAARAPRPSRVGSTAASSDRWDVGNP